jgi:hypothetical protein
MYEQRKSGFTEFRKEVLLGRLILNENVLKVNATVRVNIEHTGRNTRSQRRVTNKGKQTVCHFLLILLFTNIVLIFTSDRYHVVLCFEKYCESAVCCSSFSSIPENTTFCNTFLYSPSSTRHRYVQIWFNEWFFPQTK